MSYKKEILSLISKTDIIISDLDKTLCRGRVSESIGAGYIRKEIKTGNYLRAAGAIKHAVDIKMMLRRMNGAQDAEVIGLKRFYEILIDYGLGDASTMSYFSTNHVRNKMIPSVLDVVNPFSMPKIIVTLSGSIGAEVAKSFFGFDYVLSNKDQFNEDGKLTGIKIKMMTGMDKIEAVREVIKQFGVPINRCTVIGDGVADIPLLKEAKVKIASPFASKSVFALPEIIKLKPIFDTVH